MFFAPSPEEEISAYIAHGPIIQVFRVMEVLIFTRSFRSHKPKYGTCTHYTGTLAGCIWQITGIDTGAKNYQQGTSRKSGQIVGTPGG